MPEVRNYAQIESCGVWGYFLRLLRLFFFVGFKKLADITRFHVSALNGRALAQSKANHITELFEMGSSRPGTAMKPLGVENAVRDNVLFRAFAKRLDVDIFVNYPITHQQHSVL